MLKESFQLVPLIQRKELTILLYNHLQHHHGFTKAVASESVSTAHGVGSSSLRRWNKEYFRETGNISGEKRGKYKRYALDKFIDKYLPIPLKCIWPSILDQEDITRKSVAWLRSKVHNPKYHLTSAKYQAWLNEYCQTITLSPNFTNEISEATANRYTKLACLIHFACFLYMNCI